MTFQIGIADSKDYVTLNSRMGLYLWEPHVESRHLGIWLGFRM